MKPFLFMLIGIVLILVGLLYIGFSMMDVSNGWWLIPFALLVGLIAVYIYSYIKKLK